VTASRRPARELGGRNERESAYELFRRGSELLAAHHPGAASVVLERAERLEPGKASITEALARAYFDQGRHALAADRFQQMIDRDPLAHYAHFGLGLARQRLGDDRQARIHLKMAVFLKPEVDDYQRALARVRGV